MPPAQLLNIGVTYGWKRSSSNGRASESLCRNVTIAKNCCYSARSVLLVWPQAASSQLLCVDAITFPLWSWHCDGKSRTEGRVLLLWCWKSSMQRLPDLIISEKGKPHTEGTSELTIPPGMHGTTGVTCRFGEESGSQVTCCSAEVRAYHLKLCFLLLEKECRIF